MGGPGGRDVPSEQRLIGQSRMNSLQQVMTRHRHTHLTAVRLKITAGGGEWSLLHEWVAEESAFDKISQLLLLADFEPPTEPGAPTAQQLSQIVLSIPLVLFHVQRDIMHQRVLYSSLVGES